MEKDKIPFEANFYGIIENGKEKKIEIANEKEVEEILGQIDKDNFIVKDVKKGTRRRNPPYPPYTTSTLQQDASRRLGFSTKKTMIIAQQLYEGIDIKGEGTVGLITYMRTDSTRVSQEAVNATKAFVIDNFGKKNIVMGGR